MSNYILKDNTTCAFMDWRNGEINSREVSTYYCANSLLPAAIRKLVGIIQDTVDIMPSGDSFLSEPESISVQKEDPVLKVVSKNQEGTSLTFQKWRGVVKDIQDDTFIAKLTDLLRNIPDEEAEFFCADVQYDDRELLYSGAVFYWCIGYTISPSSQVRRTSFLRFQRLPLYSKVGIDKTRQKVNDIQKNITWL